tara:strand:- start:687 stop:860 length:174 start_codon:yes stop_codon:yes gene_type:complete
MLNTFFSTNHAAFNSGETPMGDRGSKDKGGKEAKKKSTQSLKEKRKAKADKKSRGDS